MYWRGAALAGTLPLWATVTPWEPQVPDLKAVLTAVPSSPCAPQLVGVRLTYTIIPVGTLQVLLGMLCISPGENATTLVMTCSEGAAQGVGWGVDWRLKVHEAPWGMKTFGLKAGLAMKPTCPRIDPDDSPGKHPPQMWNADKCCPVQAADQWR